MTEKMNRRNFLRVAAAAPATLGAGSVFAASTSGTPAPAHWDYEADVVVICSSDDEYAEYAVPAFKALNGRAMFIVAGAPACMDDLKAAGIENFIHVRVNVLETLKEFNAKLLK